MQGSCICVGSERKGETGEVKQEEINRWNTAGITTIKYFLTREFFLVIPTWSILKHIIRVKKITRFLYVMNPERRHWFIFVTLK